MTIETLAHLIFLVLIAILALCAYGIHKDNKRSAEWEAQEKARKKAREQREVTVRKTLDMLTPHNKPLFFCNSVQTTWAITVYDSLSGQNPERVEIETKGGVKLLPKGTASILLAGGGSELFEHLIVRVMHSIGVEDWGGSYCLFRNCEDLYVQLGAKTPGGITREEINRLNTRCFTPSEVWEALEADVKKSIQSRMQVR